MMIILKINLFKLFCSVDLEQFDSYFRLREREKKISSKRLNAIVKINNNIESEKAEIHNL